MTTLKANHKPLPDTVVVDFSRGAIKMALAETAGEAVRFYGITSIDVPTSESGELPELDSAVLVKRLGREVERLGWKGRRAACLLPGSATISQSFRLPSLSDVETRRALELRLGDTLHFELDEAEFNFQRGPSSEGDEAQPSMVLTAAARRATVESALRCLKAAGLVPRAVGSAAESLANLSQCVSLWDTDEASIHVDLGASSTVLNLFEGKLLRFSREVEIGAQDFIAALMRPILTADQSFELTRSQATELLEDCGLLAEDEEDLALPFGVRGGAIAPLLEPVSQRLVAEIERSIDYLSGLLERSHIDRIVLSGTAGRLRNLEPFLEGRLGTTVVHCDPVEQAVAHWRLAVCGEQPDDLAGFATILGYSIGHSRPINLLPQDERLEQAVERFSKRRRAAVLPALAASGMIALAGLPIRRDYEGAARLLEARAAQLTAELATLELSEQQRADEHVLVDATLAASGAVPDWLGLMKELSLLMPAEVELEQLEVETSSDDPNVYLAAWVHAGERPFEVISTELNTALSRSPLFRAVHVVEASVGRNGLPSRFELSVELIAAESGSGEESR